MASKQAVLGAGARFKGKISNAKSIEINGYVKLIFQLKKLQLVPLVNSLEQLNF